MFILTKFKDLVQIPPHEIYKLFRDELEDKINEKYANKVVQKIGLCVCMWDLTSASDGLIGHGTGNLNVHVEFRMMVFRPFKGEIIAAIIADSTPSGIYLSTHFFQDIFVPATMLFEGCEYVEEEQIWVWRTEDGNEIFLDKGIKVHARVESERWEDLAPRGPEKKEGEPSTSLNNTATTNRGVNGGTNDEDDENQERKVPYYIEASMAEPGLGGADWW